MPIAPPKLQKSGAQVQAGASSVMLETDSKTPKVQRKPSKASSSQHSLLSGSRSFSATHRKQSDMHSGEDTDYWKFLSGEIQDRWSKVSTHLEHFYPHPELDSAENCTSERWPTRKASAPSLIQGILATQGLKSSVHSPMTTSAGTLRCSEKSLLRGVGSKRNMTKWKRSLRALTTFTD